jgi:geranylgeranyl diphosphate synthase, type II
LDTRAYLEDRLPLVERAIEAALPSADTPPATLHAAMRHVLFPGGKRLRPALALAAAEAVGARAERALPIAVAVELVHTYSLIHDDLPCMDDDAERRGRPAVHVAFGEATAVLAGDALLTLAFQVLADAPHPDSAQARLAAIRDLALAAGSHGLVGGQVDDLRFDPADRDVARIESVHARKSAALIAASIVGGAHLAGADAESIARLRRCGECVGVAFQIADDVLDAGEDDPCSLVRAVGVEAAREHSERLLRDALDALVGFGECAEPLRALVRFAVRRHE